MRESFDKLFRRGLSFEAGRRPAQGGGADAGGDDPAANCIPRAFGCARGHPRPEVL